MTYERGGRRDGAAGTGSSPAGPGCGPRSRGDATGGGHALCALWAFPLAMMLAVTCPFTCVEAASGTYRYGGYTPDHQHAGEWGELDAPRCHVTLHRRQDHDAAYVDVSDSAATAWGQAGWWLGTSGSGIYYGTPTGYAEYRLADGTYRWIPLGSPPAGARYVVYRTPLTIRDSSGHVRYLYRIEASFVAGTVATYPYPSPTGWNAGLAESYSAPGVTEPIGPADDRALELQDGSGAGRFRLWTVKVDGASLTRSPGDRVDLVNRWHAWSVEGHLYYGPTGPVVTPRSRLDTLLPGRARGRLFAPLALEDAVRGLDIESLGVDPDGRLFGVGMGPDGRLVGFRWSVPRPGGPPVPPPLRSSLGGSPALLGDGDGEVALSLRDGTDLVVGGLGAVIWPADGSAVRTLRLPGFGAVVGAAPGPGSDTVLLARAAVEGLDVVRLGRIATGAAAHLLVHRLPLPSRAGQLGALVADPWSPGAYLAIQSSRHMTPRLGDHLDARLVRLTEVPQALRGKGRVGVSILRVPARFLTVADGAAYISGGDGAHGVRVLRIRSARGLSRRSNVAVGAVPGVAAAGFWDDPVAASLDGTVWATVHGRAGLAGESKAGRPTQGPGSRPRALAGDPPASWAASTWAWAAVASHGGRRWRVPLPPVYAAPGAGAVGVAIRATARLAAGPGFAALHPAGTDTIWIVYEAWPATGAGGTRWLSANVAAKWAAVSRNEQMPL